MSAIIRGCVEVATFTNARRLRLRVLEEKGQRQHGFTADVSCANGLCINPDHVYPRRWGAYKPPLAENPRCPSCGGGTFALWKGATKFSQRTQVFVTRRPFGQYLCRERGCGRTFYDKSRRLRENLPTFDPLAVRRQPYIFYLGLLSFTSMHADSVPHGQRCSVKACPYPANSGQQCRYHAHYFEFRWSMEWRALNYTDVHSTAEMPLPPLSSMQGWEMQHSADRTVFQHKGQYDKGWKLSENWWRENVEKYMPPPPKEQIHVRVIPEAKQQYAPETKIVNIQHTGAFILWKGFGKKKIRKSQRMRPQGWHGNHPEQKPMERFTRDTIEDVPMWAPQPEEEESAELYMDDDDVGYTPLFDDADHEQTVSR